MQPPAYDWWIANAHQDSAFLFLTEYPDGFEQAVAARLQEVGRVRDQGVINQAKYRAIWEQQRFGSLTSILNDIQPIPIPTTHRPLQGDLRTDHRAIRDHTGPFPLVGASAFWAPWAVQHDMGYLDRFTEWAVEAGMTYCRWMGSHDWPGGTIPKNCPDYFDLMHRTIGALAERGLRSQVTLATRRKLIEEPVSFAQEWASVINAHREHVCLVECVNEWNHGDNDWSDQEVQAMGGAFRARSDVPMALSAPAGTHWEDIEARLRQLYTPVAATATTIHFPRRDNTHEGPWRWVRQPWHARHGIPGCPVLTVDNEHQRWDRSAGGRDVSVAVAACLIAFIAGCGMSAHHDVYGVHNNKGEYHADTLAARLQRVFKTVLPLLPSDLPNWQSTRVGEGGGPHPFPSLLNQHWSFEGGSSSGVSRAFAAVRGTDFAMVLSGVRDQVTLHEVQPTPYRVVSLHTGDTTFEGTGPVTLGANTGQAFLVVTD